MTMIVGSSSVVVHIKANVVEVGCCRYCVDSNAASFIHVKVKVLAVNGTPSHSYIVDLVDLVSLAIWDHTVLPST